MISILKDKLYLSLRVPERGFVFSIVLIHLMITEEVNLGIKIKSLQETEIIRKSLQYLHLTFYLFNYSLIQFKNRKVLDTVDVLFKDQVFFGLGICGKVQFRLRRMTTMLCNS